MISSQSERASQLGSRCWVGRLLPEMRTLRSQPPCAHAGAVQRARLQSSMVRAAVQLQGVGPVPSCTVPRSALSAQQVPDKRDASRRSKGGAQHGPVVHWASPLPAPERLLPLLHLVGEGHPRGGVDERVLELERPRAVARGRAVDHLDVALGRRADGLARGDEARVEGQAPGLAEELGLVGVRVHAEAGRGEEVEHVGE
mmetsp:Transcript_3959/g.13263  ORF Transcript_3959/g.13263 Transcript_3959/m.13263 type:complete len:200 (-) Transcript_3959:824-1423(-)